jgi:hypothetical protein
MTTNSDPLVRLELLISHIADLVWPSRDLVNALRLRANTTSIERGHLDYLIDTTDALSDQLDAFGDEVRETAQVGVGRNTTVLTLTSRQRVR